MTSLAGESPPKVSDGKHRLRGRHKMGFSTAKLVIRYAGSALRGPNTFNQLNRNLELFIVLSIPFSLK